MNVAESIKDEVRRHYGEAARRVAKKSGPCCAGPAKAVGSGLYRPEDIATLPKDIGNASWGSGNPVAFADLKPGEIVLDLGSGGGLDCILAAKRVGPSGKIIGVDMTDEMLELARNNAARAGVSNVEFRKGELESLPLADASVDVIISNCVINLSPDKDRVFAESFRVLRPGGRFVVSDIVLTRELDPATRASSRLWCECVSGALRDEEFLLKLEETGFADVHIVPEGSSEYVPGIARSALVKARKP